MRLDALALLASLGSAAAFYVPGLSPNIFRDGDKVDLFVNKISSERTQLPYSYYDLPFVCGPNDPLHDGSDSSAGQRRKGLNLGEILRGDRISASDYKVRMGCR